MITTMDFRTIRDKTRGLDRKKIYGSSRAHFPLPYQTATKTRKARIGTPVFIIREDNETKNYDNKQNVKKMLAMF